MPGRHVASRAVLVGSCALLACTAPKSAPSVVSILPTTKIVGAPPPAPEVPPLPRPSYLTSARIVATETGTLVVDADSGSLIKTDREGAPTARLAIGRNVGLLAFDAARSLAFIADREHDRVTVVDVRDAMAIARTWPTPAEPFAIALTPDASTVLVSTIADRTLVALDAQTGAERWRASLSSEPRTIAVSPDGKRALIASVGAGGLDEVDLDTHRVSAIAFDLLCDRCTDGPAFARSSGAVMFLDEKRAIAAFQRAVPSTIDTFGSSSTYGGSWRTPITQHLSFLSFDATATTQVVAQMVANAPRSLLWNRDTDSLYIAGLASDTLLRLQGLLTGTTDDTENAASDFVLRPRETCGPDGLAQSTEGEVYVWCSLSRTIVRMPEPAANRAHRRSIVESQPIAASSLTPAQHRGAVLFNTVNMGVNRDRAIACSTCHIDGRTDGHSWKIRDLVLQTPILAGRIAQTAPYKWAATDKTIQNSIERTIRRLGGHGLDKPATADLVAYLATLSAPRAPTLDRAAVARGKHVFEDADCDTCHLGKHLTDRSLHDFGPLWGHSATPETDDARHLFKETMRNIDTPSLIGLAASAPYFHDGSATTLEDLVAGRGSVKQMADMSKLTDAQRADLVAFLSSL